MLRGRGSNRIGAWTFLLMFLLMTAAPGLAGAATVELVSGTETASDSFGASVRPALSADGRYVAFLSNAPNLVPGQVDDNLFYDVFLHDRIAGTTTLVSHAAGAPTHAARVDGPSNVPELAISADGRYVAFTSPGVDLVPGAVDDNRQFDVFLWDRVTGTTTLVSHAAGAPGTAADGASFSVRVSADGNFVAFLSSAGNLVAGQVEPAPNVRSSDVFLWNRASDATLLVSRKSGTAATAANQGSAAIAISADGGVVAFTTFARDLLSTVIDVNPDAEVYTYQRSTDTLSLVSRAGNSPQSAAGASADFVAVSADGRYVAFASHSDNLILGQVDDRLTLDAFLYDRVTGEMRLASHRSASPLLAGGIIDPFGMAMSAGGRYVAFASGATDLVPGQVDTNQALDVFVYDRVTGAVALLSHSRGSVTTAGSPGATNTPSPSGQPRFSADGRFVVFHSTAVDLVSGQTDVPGTVDVFLYDQASRSATLVSRTRASASTAGNGSSFAAALSADGGVAAFLSEATDLGEGQTDPYSFVDLFLYHRTSGEITNPSRRDPDLPPLTALHASTLGGLSADGRFVVFENTGVFLRDAVADTTTRLRPPSLRPYTEELSKNPVLSADGRFAAFISSQYGPGTADALFLYDREAGTFTLVNHAPGSATRIDGSVSSFALSADGRYVAYQCSACGLVRGHSHPSTLSRFEEIFLYDRLSGANTLVSRAANTDVPAFPPDGQSYAPAISADGRYVVFWSSATNLFPGQIDVLGTQDLFVFDRVTGAVELVTHVPGSPARAAGRSTNPPLAPAGLSADGRFIAFESELPNLVPGQMDTNEGFDVFLRDQVARSTVLVSHASFSTLPVVSVTAGNRPSGSLEIEPVSISADGRFLVYESLATDLVADAEDTNGALDVFLYDRLSGENTLVSHAHGAPLRAGNGESELPGISADGSHVAFLSGATDLTPGPIAPPASPASRNLYVRDRSAGATTFIAQALRFGRPFHPFPGDFGDPISFAPRLSADGRRIAFTSDAALVRGDYNGFWDVYLWDKDGTAEPQGPHPLPPCKLLDTRRRAERPVLTANVQRTVAVHGRCGVPATAKEILVEVTVFNPSGKGNLRFYPGAATGAPSAILRFERGTTRTGSFTLPLGTNGTLTILPFVAGRGTVHVAVEVSGYDD